ncbi:MAG: hypothetical protein ABR576_06020 [Thermoanaerobaculia bacterium]
MSPLALIAPDLRRAEATARLLAPIHRRLAPHSVESFLRSRRKFRGIVIDAGAGTPAQARAFVERVRRRLLFPLPSARLSAAIAGLRDAPEESATRLARGAGRSGLLLEGAVHSDRARRALARSELSRDWIVEDPRRIRFSETALEELAREGVRWFALTPLELVAIAAGPSLRRDLRRAKSGIPRGTPFWDLPT